MLPVHSNSTTVVADLSDRDFFLKDGRKIHVGDCALFKPPLDSPPFIGIIRKLKSDKKDSYSLDVNWLYRPADIKLAKGILSDTAPNEVFYSFHKDEIPAASLLHPCKVAFLRKGVELPSGLSSFVCRRVYDTDHKCLWWLTDKDYIKERQEEVDLLLDKTRLEMHGAVQSGGHSPKPLNGPTSALQSKPGSDSVQNSSSLISQGKGKKRERVDPGSEPGKRERSSKTENGDTGQFRPENMLKSEIAKITDKGGLVDFEGVEKLIKLMQPDSVDKKIDLAGRIMLVDVIAVTDRFDCLGWFLQRRGLPVLDEWLQEVHKGKIGDGSGLKENDKSIEDFLLALLRALDKLPVNLHALQTCHVGKSVNNLRTHKNTEIQRKARSLVDTWKKRVEAEMNVNDPKSGPGNGVSWPSKSAPSEVSNIVSRKAGGSSEGGIKSSTPKSAISKTPQSKFCPTETVAKSSISTDTVKHATSMVITLKDQNLRFTSGGGTSDLPLTPIKEERSSSSSQSQNNSQSSEHAKIAPSSCREDARSSTTGSASKISGGASRHRKSSNGHHGATASGVYKESGSGKLNAFNKNTANEKASATSNEKLSDVPLVDHGNSRLIVRLPNTSRSPARSATAGSSEDPATSCGRGSHTERPTNNDKKVMGNYDKKAMGNYDKKVMGKINTLQSSSAMGASYDLCAQKDEMTGSEEGNVLSPCDKQENFIEDEEMHTEVSKITNLSTGSRSHSKKSYEASLSSMNALIESCVKFSEATASPGDDVGMNLLASVAAEEISKSNVSPLLSPWRKSPGADHPSLNNRGRLEQLCEEVAQTQLEANGGPGFSSDQVITGKIENESSHPVTCIPTNSSGDKGATAFACSDRLGDSSTQPNSSALHLQQNLDTENLSADAKPGGLGSDTSLAMPSFHAGKEGNMEAVGTDRYPDENKLQKLRFDKESSISDSRLKVIPLLHENKRVDNVNLSTADKRLAAELEATASKKSEREIDVKSPCLSSETGIENGAHKESNNGIVIKTTTSLVQDEEIEDALGLPESNELPDIESKGLKDENVNPGGHAEQDARHTVKQDSIVSVTNGDCADENVEKNDLVGCSSGLSGPLIDFPSVPVKENDPIEKLSRFNLDVSKSEEAEEHHASSAKSLSSVAGSNSVVKLNFDLNEGFSVDDGSKGEVGKLVDTGNSCKVQLPCPFPFSMSSMSGSFPASITVASAAKGPVVPPENVLHPSGVLGWKGSAATSAFRPAEPRKVLEMPLCSVDTLFTTSSKQGSHHPLDFDLNEPDETLLEEVASQSALRVICDESGPRYLGSGGLGLDLNKVDVGPELGSLSMGNSRFEIPTVQSRPSFPGGRSNAGLNISRNFDLNNGPCLEEVGSDMTPRNLHMKTNMTFPSPLPGMRMNSVEFGSFSSWFPLGNSYPAMTAVPSVLPGRGEQSFVSAAGPPRVLAPPTGTTSFAAEMYRTPVLSSSPAVPFSPANPLPYPGFPFETGLHMPSNSFSGSSTAYMDSASGGSLCFPTIHSQLVGPAGVVSTSYPRPYIMSFPGNSNFGPDSGKWGSLGLDLNAGPSGTDIEKRDERLSSSLRPLSAPNTTSFIDEHQLKMFQVGGVPKRKEPDSGLDAASRFSFKHPSWQ